MRILLQDPNTRLYVQGKDLWTENPAEACNFVTALGAINFCEEKALFHAEIVLKYEAGQPQPNLFRSSIPFRELAH